MRLQHILAFVAIGILYAVIQPGRFDYALGHSTLYVFLPPLLFEAAWNLNYRAIARQWRAIVTLAGPGVILTALLIAAALVAVRVPFGVALLTGAILSATDPIAVLAVFRRLKIPKSLATIVECESLFNDAVAVVLYRAVLLLLFANATPATVATVSLLSIAGALGGVALGIAWALLASRVLRNSSEAGTQIAATIVCAYGSYFAGDELHLSGIFAVIACGIALRYFERNSVALNIAEDVNRFWDVSALFANAAVFFMVGAALQLAYITHNVLFVIATLVGVAISRFVVGSLLLRAGFPRQWLDVIRIAGLRSALSLALALALPPATPYREAIIGATFAVVLATLAVSATSVPAVVSRSRKRAV